MAVSIRHVKRINSDQKLVPEIKLIDCASCRLEDWSCHSLKSPFWRLYRNNTSNAFVLFPDGSSKRLLKGKIYLIAPETDITGNSVGVLEHFYIHFTVGEPFQFCRDKVWEVEETLMRWKLVESIIEDISGDSITSLFSGMRVAQLCMSALLEVPEADLPLIKIGRRIGKVLKHIEDQGAKPITNSKLAAVAGMSTNAFIRLFSESVKTPPQQYLMEERLRKACMMLGYTEMTIDEIAEATGFCDRYYFTRMFKKYRTVSPAEYRKHSF